MLLFRGCEGATCPRLTLVSVSSKTGIVLKDTGIRDEHGMEPLDALFSSPRKEASEEENVSGDDGSGEDMDITTSTAFFSPSAVLGFGYITNLQSSVRNWPRRLAQWSPQPIAESFTTRAIPHKNQLELTRAEE